MYTLKLLYKCLIPDKLIIDSPPDLPIKKGTSHSSGYDIPLDETIIIKPKSEYKLYTGIYIKQFPTILGFDTHAKLYMRSSITKIPGLLPKIGVGIIDNDYRNEIIIAVVNVSDRYIELTRGQYIAQLVFEPNFPIGYNTVVKQDIRLGGFGSTDGFNNSSTEELMSSSTDKDD